MALESSALRLKAEKESLITKSLLLHAASGLEDAGRNAGDVYVAAEKLRESLVKSFGVKIGSEGPRGD